MNTRTMTLTAVAVAILAAAGYGLYAIGMNRGMQMGGAIPAAPAAAKSGNLLRLTYSFHLLRWSCCL